MTFVTSLPRACIAYTLAALLSLTAAIANEAKVEVKRYPLTGVIREVKASEGVLVVRHDAIPDFMPAMTMEFIVSPGDAAIAKAGQAIRAELVQEGDDFRLEKIWPADPTTSSKIETASKAIVQDTMSRGRSAFREVGESVPEFTLLDQEGNVVDSNRFRGKQVLLNFIFTRCPIPNMCPAAVARFQQVQSLAKENEITNFELVSISLDPEYDTPGVLKEFALQRMIDTSNYTLLTGPDLAVKSLLRQFGVLTNLKGDLLNHTLATLLIDEKGKIIHRVDGSTWNPNDFAQRLRKP